MAHRCSWGNAALHQWDVIIMSECHHAPTASSLRANQRSAQYVTVLNCRMNQRAGDTSGGCGIVYNRGTADEETIAQVLHTDARATHSMWV